MNYKFKSSLFTAFFLILFSGSSIAQTRAEVQKEIDKIIHFDTALDLDEIPGLVIGIAIGDSTYFYTYHFDPQRKEALTKNSLFEIGDISKAFTSLVYFKAVHEGQININQLVSLSQEEQEGLNINMTQLLSHRAGFPLRPNDFGEKEIELEDPYANFSKKNLQTYLGQLDANHLDPVGKFNYSHLGYAAIELYLEKQLGKSYEELIAELCQNLGMTSAFFSSSTKTTSSDIVQGYNRIGQKVSPRKYPSFGGSEGLVSSAADLITLARRSWLDCPEWLAQSYAESWPMPESKEMAVSTGWFHYQPKKFRSAIIQSGSSAGHRSFLGFVPETKTAVVVLTNSKKSHKGLGYLILKMLNFDWKHPQGRLKSRQQPK